MNLVRSAGTEGGISVDVSTSDSAMAMFSSEQRV